MLVAVMARTLEQVTEIQEQLQFKFFTQLVTDTLWLSRRYKDGISKHYKRYLYIVEPSIDTAGEASNKDEITCCLNEIENQVKSTESELLALHSTHCTLLSNVDNLQDSIFSIQSKLNTQSQLLGELLK